jgi:hypothetical protein
MQLDELALAKTDVADVRLRHSPPDNQLIVFPRRL